MKTLFIENTLICEWNISLHGCDCSQFRRSTDFDFIVSVIIKY